MKEVKAFVKTVLDFYKDNKRSMPWRDDTRPYSIVVSEIMLQQTQVHRVIPKYTEWMKLFPDWESLVHADTKQVLTAWMGLGYNRRALYLKKIAEEVTSNEKYSFLNPDMKTTLSHRKRNLLDADSAERFSASKARILCSLDSTRVRGKKRSFEGVPDAINLLQLLPGIGPNTAGAILTYAFNISVPFIETNIRSVFIHHFFLEIDQPSLKLRHGKKKKEKCPVSDKQIFPYIEKVLQDERVSTNPREWYWALMDYGSHLKKQLPNPSRRSTHHAKQSTFEGSHRKLRADILKCIIKKSITLAAIEKQFHTDVYQVKQIREAVKELASEGFIQKNTHTNTYSVN